jgi:hypothetical protein
MPERKEKSQLIGDAIRDGCVLVLVFYALDTGIKGNFDWTGFGIVAAGAIGIFYLGMILEGSDEL